MVPGSGGLVEAAVVETEAAEAAAAGLNERGES